MVIVQGLISVEDPHLTYQDGDVIFYTSSHPSGIFVVHRDVLAASSRYFKAAMSEEWDLHARSGSGPGSPKVYEMDLEFDLETSVALPVIRKPRDASVIDSSGTQKPSASTIPDTFTPPEKQQFLWNQPPKITAGCANTKVRTRSIYQRFFAVPACDDERDSSLNEMLLWRGDTHNQALLWVQLIWKCLLHLMYGYQISLPDIYYWRKQTSLVASLYACADVIGTPAEMKQRISQIIFTLPDLWRRVSESPKLFFHLAYAVDLPDLYMDAVKHWVSQEGIWEFPPTHIADPGRHEDKYAIILASYAARERYLQPLRQKLGWWLDACGYWRIGKLPVERYRDPEVAIYGPLLQRVFSRELFPALAQLDRPCRVFEKDFQTGIAALRWVRDISCGPQQSSVFEEAFGLSKHIDLPSYNPENVSILVKEALIVYEAITTPLKISVVTSTRRNGHEPRSGCEHGHYAGCTNSSRARFQSQRYFASMDPKHLFVGRSVRPWPLNGELEEEEMRGIVKPETTETEVASYEYLESIGLGTVFAHLARKKRLVTCMVREEEDG